MFPLPRGPLVLDPNERPPSKDLQEEQHSHRVTIQGKKIIASGMMRTKFSRGWAPESSQPLMKKTGVPVTPARVPSSTSFCTTA